MSPEIPFSSLAAKKDPIIALCSGHGRAGVALIRMSSPKPFKALRPAFSFRGEFPERKAIVCRLLHGQKTLDHILLHSFKAPKSYTGEFVLELSVHGNPLNVRRILQFFQEKHHLRLAAPGEFTYRAFRNGKLSLGQVEGLDLLLNATSVRGLNCGLHGLQGETQRDFLALREHFLNIKAALELSIDFLEDVGEETAEKNLATAIASMHDLLTKLQARCQIHGNFPDPSVVLVGRPNAGKSTLFNTLLQKPRALVSENAGTTRDYVSESIWANGLPFRLTDTAGLRETPDPLEREGIQKVFDLLKDAFYGLYVWNPLQGPLPLKELDSLHLQGVVATHMDLPTATNALKNQEIPPSLDLYTSCAPIGPQKNGPIGPAPQDKGTPIEKLWPSLRRLYEEQEEHYPITAERQIIKIQKLQRDFTAFQELATTCRDMAILSSEANLIGQELDELIGLVSPEDVLEKVFSNFCIGK